MEKRKENARKSYFHLFFLFSKYFKSNNIYLINLRKCKIHIFFLSFLPFPHLWSPSQPPSSKDLPHPRIPLIIYRYRTPGDGLIIIIGAERKPVLLSAEMHSSVPFHYPHLHSRRRPWSPSASQAASIICPGLTEDSLRHTYLLDPSPHPHSIPFNNHHPSPVPPQRTHIETATPLHTTRRSRR